MSEFTYQSPLQIRYAGSTMQKLFSPKSKYEIWRKLWLALAEAQKSLGLPISEEQIQELKTHVSSIDFEAARQYELKFRHDVMAHIHAYGDQCPAAKSIIHLGATSCFVTDNGDLIQFRTGLQYLSAKLIQLIRNLSRFAKKTKDIPCLGFTHFQPAQPTTVGKRITLWLQDFLFDYQALQGLIRQLPFLGLKGATGTQASLLALFGYNHHKVESCDRSLAHKFGFEKLLIISGQTYPRKWDTRISDVLKGIAVSAQKLATDLRLLSHLREMEEPRTADQIGSSAMPYKQNPVLSERICSLSRFLIHLSANSDQTAAAQWLERSLDDSANRRISLPESFLTCDALFNLLLHISSNFHLNRAVIHYNLQKELPFLATENILMHISGKGGDRQFIHEILRQHASFARKRMLEEGKENDLLDRIIHDPRLAVSQEEMNEILNISQLIGRSKEQVESFLQKEIEPLLRENKESDVPYENVSF